MYDCGGGGSTQLCFSSRDVSIVIQSDFVKCSSLGDQLKKEKANVRILQDDYENCTFTVKNKTKESDQLKVELAAAKAIVGNLTSTISNLTSQVIRVNITGEQKLKNKMSSVVRLLRYTTVMEAAKAGDPETTKFLIETGASVNSRDVSHNLRRTPLHWAAREGFLSVVQLLIQSGASLETKSDAGYTPLLEAAYNGHTDVCRLLLDLGANVSALNIHNNTPLHWAASNNHIATVRLLVQRGANCDARNNDGQTPRSLASDYRHDDIVSWMQYGCGR